MRREREYEMLAVDLDGTLLRSDRSISQRNALAVRELLARGTRVVVASARPARSIRRYYLELGLRDPIVSLNGALVYDPTSERAVREIGVDAALVRDVLAVLRRHDVVLTLETGEGWYVERPEPAFLRALERSGTLPPTGVDRLDSVAMRGVAVYKILGLPTERVLPEAGRELREELSARFGAALRVNVSSDGFVEIATERVSKCQAIAALAAAWGLEPGQVAAIGDDANDLEMIRWAGLGIAMGNAIPSVKAVAQVVTRGNDDDGAAEAIEEYLRRRTSERG